MYECQMAKKFINDQNYITAYRTICCEACIKVSISYVSRYYV